MNALTPFRPLRSVLYVPGSKPRALEKARSLPVDGLILDLEDAVLPEAKPAAREAVVKAATGGQFPDRDVIIRINGLDTPWGLDDLAAVASSPATAVLLPKVDGPQHVREAVGHLVRAGARPDLKVWVMAETPRGIQRIVEIAGSSERLAVIVMGTADLAKALRIPADNQRTGLLPALAQCVLAARAQGLDILDGVFTDVGDDSGFRESCLQGRQLGFDGKTLIHPGQIDAANEVFGVSDADAAAAAALIAAWEAAAAGGAGIAVVDGHMVERLHAEEARRLLALHGAIRRRLHT
jgi:citrate lyase subunit beta / citryl-CoA lyase